MVSNSVRCLFIHLAAWTIPALVLFFTSPASATPIDPNPFRTFAGNVNFQMTGSSLRTLPNGPRGSEDACQVLSEGDITSAELVDLPNFTDPSDQIKGVYLYWAGSGSTIDSEVWFQGRTINADRTFTERFTYVDRYGRRINYDFFSGFADITDLNLVNRNDTYTFSGLTVDSGGNYCASTAVLAGWSLIVFYEHPGEPLRVINLYDGFEYFQNNQITLTPTNFRVPTNGCDDGGDCKWGILTWEGDPDLPDSVSPAPEVLSIAGNNVSNGTINPVGNQFNSTIDLMNRTPRPTVTSIHGVDIDIYDLQYLLSEAESVTTIYRSGQDLVLLSAEIIAVRNVPVTDLSISKTASSNFLVGFQGIYTLRVTNNGPSDHTGEVTVTDRLPPGLTFVSAGGTDWNCTYSDPEVTCTSTEGPITVGDSWPDITLTVDVGASALPTVTNTASVETSNFDLDDSNDDASATVSVIDPSTGSGTKQLYFYMSDVPAPDTNTIQRVRVAGGQATFSNISAGSAVDYLLTPEVQTPLVLENNPINVDLWLRRTAPSNSGTRTVTVTLDDNGGPIGRIGTDTITLSGGGMQWINFTFNPIPPTPITILPGSTLRLNLTNASSSGSIRARSLMSGRRSQIAFDTSTVINVDSVAAFTDVPYPGGVVQPNYAPGTPIRIRADVSDPFGHEDITSAYITLIDPSGSPVFTNEAMIPIATPLSATPAPPGTKIYERQPPYTIPATSPDGIWTIIVTANEGREGTISAQDTGTFLVGLPNIVMTKSVSTISNPMEGTTNAHAIPGAIMQYEIVVTNTGINPLDPGSIIITDALPENLRLVLNSSIEPVAFIDGDQYGQRASGLSFTPADVGNNTGPIDDVAVSNWSGIGTRTYLPKSGISVDTEGVDNLTSKINFIRINPKGTFAGSTGGPDPSFTLRFRLKLD